MSNPGEIDLREAHIKSLHEMEELKRVQEFRIDEFSRRRLIEDRDTNLELTGKIQELQNEINCMNDSRDFQDAKQENNHTCLLTLTSTNNARHKVHPLHGGIGVVHGGLLIILKVEKEVSQVLSER